MTAIWLGIDPGAREAGIVARQQNELLAWTVLDRREKSLRVQQVLDAWIDVIDQAAATLGDSLSMPYRWAIEDFNDPTPAMGRIRAKDGIQTARIVEAFRRLRPDIVLVPPGGHGHRPFLMYPEQLRTVREWNLAVRANRTYRPAPQNTPLRHARSAFDVAGAAPAAERLAGAAGRARRPNR